MKKAVQQIMLGTVTGTEARARETLSAIRKAGYDGIELNGFMIRPSSLFVRLLTKFAGMPTGRGGKLNWSELVREAGLSVVGIHEDLAGIEKDPESILREAEAFGTDRIIITGMYRFDYGSEEKVRELAGRLNTVGQRLKAGGVTLLYHNHNAELQKPLPNQTAYDLLISGTDPEYVGFEPDSYWFTEGGADVKAIMRKLEGRMRMWHINDRGFRRAGVSMTPILTSDSMELGTGNMDLDGLADLAGAGGVDTVILESHKNHINGSPVQSLELSAEWLNARF